MVKIDEFKSQLWLMSCISMYPSRMVRAQTNQEADFTFSCITFINNNVLYCRE